MKTIIIITAVACLLYLGFQYALKCLAENRRIDQEKEKEMSDCVSDIDAKVNMYKNLRGTEIASHRIWIGLTVYAALIIMLAWWYAI